jgi:hypothetical protein
MQLLKLVETINRGSGGVITRKQTTYLDLVTDLGGVRINFHRKREFQFVDDSFGTISVFAAHPLLLDYIEPMAAVHLGSSVEDKARFRELLEDTAVDVFARWRSLERYLNMPLDEFLEKPYGLLMTAPESFAQMVAERAESIGVRLIVHNGYIQGLHPKALLIGDNFVVADDFSAEVLQTA